MTTILNALSKELDQLPSQERRIAEVILTSPAEVTGLSIKELAENSGTSPATVTRFCKSRHFRGFPTSR